MGYEKSQILVKNRVRVLKRGPHTQCFCKYPPGDKESFTHLLQIANKPPHLTFFPMNRDISFDVMSVISRYIRDTFVNLPVKYVMYTRENGMFIVYLLFFLQLRNVTPTSAQHWTVSFVLSTLFPDFFLFVLS